MYWDLFLRKEESSMKYIFDSRLISGNETIFYIYLVVIILIILFAIITTYKEIKNGFK